MAEDVGGFRLSVRVKPGAKHPRVGGAYREALVVAVSAPATEGTANDAVRRALAAAFGVRVSAVHLVRGQRGRDKLVLLDPAPPDAAARLRQLRDGEIS